MSHTFEVGDSVERRIGDLRSDRWEEGYTVIEPPEVAFPGFIYIGKPHSRGFKYYYVGVPPEFLRHAANPKID